MSGEERIPTGSVTAVRNASHDAVVEEHREERKRHVEAQEALVVRKPLLRTPICRERGEG
jgi:hypothetical protein